MKYRLSKIYTGKGDEGYTSFQDKKISKDDLILEAAGTIDELNSYLGFLLSLSIESTSIKTLLTQIQHSLFDLGGELHTPQHKKITATHITNLEQMIDDLNKSLPPLKEFLLPNGNAKSAACHIARTICRRVERHLVGVHRRVPLTNLEILRYINRLSDLLFVMARVLVKEDNSKEVLWNNLKTE